MFIITDVVKLFIPAALSFALGIGLAVMLSHYLYKYKLWKKKAGKIDLSGNATPIFNALHKEKEVGTPRMGGIIVWLAPLLTIFLLSVLATFFPAIASTKLELLSRNQTWLPLFALLLGGIVGLIDDAFEIMGRPGRLSGGLSLKKRLLIVGSIGLAAGAWFYVKLGVTAITIPVSLGGTLTLGVFFIPFFALVVMALYSGGIIDGLDGLAGGVFASMFAAYAAIAFAQAQINLAAFCLAIVGAILAFLWFNIPPARFYMSETGSMALTITLAIVAFLTDALTEGRGIIVLPIIAAPLFATSFSVIIQLLSKKFRGGKKIFLAAPMHHHFEAIGWPAYKVTMRYWIISVVLSIVGVILALVQ